MSPVGAVLPPVVAIDLMMPEVLLELVAVLRALAVLPVVALLVVGMVVVRAAPVVPSTTGPFIIFRLLSKACPRMWELQLVKWVCVNINSRDMNRLAHSMVATSFITGPFTL